MKPGPLWEKKDKHCDPAKPADKQSGSWWDHVLLDTDSRLIVSLVVGRRTGETVAQAWADFYRRTDGLLPALVTTDEYSAYLTALLETYGVGKEDLELTDEEKEELALIYQAKGLSEQEAKALAGRLIANQASLKTRTEAVQSVVSRLRKAAGLDR